MSVIALLAAALTALAVLAATLRLLLGPTSSDRIVAADTVAVITTPVIAWLAAGLDNPMYLDVALVYGALSFVGVVALARTLEGGAE